MDFQDEVKTCIDCGKTFVFSIGEQKFFQAKLLSPPLRCQPCRKKRKHTIVPDPLVKRWADE